MHHTVELRRYTLLRERAPDVPPRSREHSIVLVIREEHVTELVHDRGDNVVEVSFDENSERITERDEPLPRVHRIREPPAGEYQAEGAVVPKAAVIVDTPVPLDPPAGTLALPARGAP